jgi:hypothetical protein
MGVTTVEHIRGAPEPDPSVEVAQDGAGAAQEPNRYETDTPILPFFIKDYSGGFGWRQAVRAYQEPPAGAPVGLSTLRQLNAGAPLAVAQFSRDFAPGTSIENLTMLTVEAKTGATTVLSAAARLSAATRPVLWAVDPAMKAGDKAAGVLVKGSYIRNPTARTLTELVTETGKIGGKKMSGKFMYVVDEAGEIIIGTRAGQRMPHPTLVGGANPLVQAAGIVDIRGGKIFSVNNASGHFKAGTESLSAAKKAFGKLPGQAFHAKFEGFVGW